MPNPLPVRVTNISRGHAYNVYCGRTGRGIDGPFGNYTPERTAQSYWLWFIQPDQLNYRLNFLSQVRPDTSLGCFCHPRPCHADALATYANARFDGHSDADACAAVQALLEPR